MARTKAKSGSDVMIWQGWRLELPPRWHPLRIEGDYDTGNVLLGDLHGPRLGMRWKKASGRRFSAADWSRSAIRAEVGSGEADKARPHSPTEQFEGGLLYLDPDPPGRDVWTAYSPASKRVIEVVYRSRRKEHPLAAIILPVLADHDPAEPVPWSIFGLSAIVPAGYRLQKHQLNAGDLNLWFTAKKQELVIRQVALASQAMSRMPMIKWLNQTEWPRRKYFRRYAQPAEHSMEVDGRSLRGLSSALRRRRRFSWLWTVPHGYQTLALHDEARDRLVFVQATDPDLPESIVKTIGWAG